MFWIENLFWDIYKDNISVKGKDLGGTYWNLDLLKSMKG